MRNITEITGPLEIKALGRGGEGLIDDGAVPFTLPGELIENGKISAPSPDRIVPVCAHFGTCGGCQLQHASDEFLRDWKVALVENALASHGLKTTTEFVHASPPGSRRRVTFSGRRTKKTVQLGFFARRSETLVSVDECPVLSSDIMDKVDLLKDLVRLGASRKSLVKLSVTVVADGLDLAVWDAVELDRAKLAQTLELARGVSRLTWNGEVVAAHGTPMVHMDGIALSPPPGAFLQATLEGQAALIACVLDGIQDARKVVDLFAGCGTFTLPLARMATVHAVENDAPALAALDAAWRKAEGLKSVTTECRDLFRRPLLSAEFKDWDTVVIDPPRAGAAAQIAEIATSSVRRVIHVSCNPATFARDAKSLTDAGCRLDWVKVIDQFRWTNHVELVASFQR